jgi:serine/threonine protein phosphatase PrpC
MSGLNQNNVTDALVVVDAVVPSSTPERQALPDVPGVEIEKPCIPCIPWSIGTATKTGNVRSENQDVCRAFQINGHDVLLVADGCGGLPHGGKAASLTVSCAEAFLLTVLQTEGKRIPLKTVALRAILKSAQELSKEARLMNIHDVAGGLRSTLIVVVAGATEAGYAYIGDGGGIVLKSNGEIKNFLKPQKASATALNVLSASLGPDLQGWPRCGTLPREKGDLIIAGTDGIFDRIQDLQTFAKNVLYYCVRNAGDLFQVAAFVTEEMISFRDDAGYVCDDNVSLGLIGNGQPVLSSGFWNYLQEFETA